jgi:hypothetical protein
MEIQMAVQGSDQERRGCKVSLPRRHPTLGSLPSATVKNRLLLLLLGSQYVWRDVQLQMRWGDQKLEDGQYTASGS